jgi:hypothetical protein
VEKLLKADFIREVTCPSWLLNIVLVKKSNGDWRTCIDFTYLNKAFLINHFPLPRIDQLIDPTSGFAYLSFIDVFTGYNQIIMHPNDEDKTTLD